MYMRSGWIFCRLMALWMALDMLEAFVAVATKKPLSFLETIQKWLDEEKIAWRHGNARFPRTITSQPVLEVRASNGEDN